MSRPLRPGPAERAATVIESGPGQPHGPPVERSATVVETDEDVRQALLAHVRGAPQGPPEPAAPAEAEAVPSADPFRPTVRPPIPVLTVFDDGKEDGEVLRLRGPRFVIGRTEGDLRIPLDGRVSSRHAEVTLQTVAGRYRWVVTDLQSTHGLFVRVSRTALADGAEFLVGNGRYRFDAPPPPAAESTAGALDPVEGDQTRGWDGAASPVRAPSLSELFGDGIGNRLLLVKPEYWIGSDPSCPVSRPDDPFCEPKHARLFRGPRGGWLAEHNKTRNGLWLRTTQIVVDSVLHFQVGEQRFRLKVR